MGAIEQEESRDADGVATENLDVAWLRLVLVVLVQVAGALGTTVWITSRIGARRTNRLVIITFLGSAGLASMGAAAWSHHYWGYALRRPPATRVTDGIAEVHGLTFLRATPSIQGFEVAPTTDWSISRELAYCEKDEYYCLDGRLVREFDRRGLLSPHPPTVPSPLLSTALEGLNDSSMLVPGDPGYDHALDLRGVVISGSDATGRTVVIAALSGGQVSNDHYPHYEFSVAMDGPPVITASHRFFYDVAGIEGVEGWPIYVGVSAIVLAFTLPGAVGIATFRARPAYATTRDHLPSR